MATRPRPTKQLLIDMCGGNQGLISSVHHGLVETPLSDFYPNLNLDETLAFAAASWQSRRENYKSYSETVRFSDINYIFAVACESGFSWLRRHNRVSDGRLQRKYDRLNPFSGRNLRDRLARVSPEAVEKLKGELLETVDTHVFDIQFSDRKASRGGNDSKIRIMKFQAVYPKRGKIVPAFASEIARLISGYDVKYEPLPKP